MNKILKGVAYGLTVLGLVIIASVVVKLPTSAPGPQVIRPMTTKDFSKVTVKIMTKEKNSGGTGVILSGSIILTNKHICDAIQNGGLVIYGGQEYKITSYKPYPKHDLCMIATSHNFGIGVQVADKPADMYSPATISGHPSLLPLVVNAGHFSGRMTINLIVEMKECGEEPPPEHLMECLFLGGIPVQQSFDAQLVTGTIKPGSSGSPVFNQHGELTNVAFASSSPFLDYALTVPQEYVRDFYNNSMMYKWYKPSSKAKRRNLFMKSIQAMNLKCTQKALDFCSKYSFLTPEFTK